MTDLRDSKLTATQVGVLIELNTVGKLPKGVRQATLDKLFSLHMIDQDGPDPKNIVLTNTGRKEIGAPVHDLPEIEQTPEEILLDEEYFDEEILAEHEMEGIPFNQVQDSDGVLKTPDWVVDPEITVDEVEDIKAIIRKNELMSQWQNSEVWADMSLEEVKEDIKTAHHINRAARRRHTKLLTSEYRKVFCPRPRKALKLTGKVGV